MREIKFIYKLLDKPENGVIGKFLADNSAYFNELKFQASGLFPDGGSFNGYIAVLPDHPFYGKGYDEVNEMLDKKDFYVHGGLTLAENSSFCPNLPIESKYWILGFDTRHAGDTSAYWTEERTWEEANKLMQVAINYEQ